MFPKPLPKTSLASVTMKKAFGSMAFTSLRMSVIWRFFITHMSTSRSSPVYPPSPRSLVTPRCIVAVMASSSSAL